MVLAPKKIKIHKYKILKDSQSNNKSTSFDMTEIDRDEEGNIIFDFDYISTDCVKSCAEDREASDDEINYIIHRANKEINDYEKYLFIKYWYKAFKYKLECLKDEEDLYDIMISFIPMFFRVLKRSKIPFFSFKVFKKFSEKDVISKITKLKFIQDSLKKSFKKDGFPIIKDIAFIKSKKIKSIFTDLIKNVILDCEEFFKTIDETKLKKSFYSENFITYINLINIDQDSRFYDWVVFNFYSGLRIFEIDMPDIKTCLEDNYPSISEIKEYSNFLTFIHPDSYSLKKARLDEIFLKRCWTKYKNKEDLIKEIIPDMKYSKLTYKDFVYVPEYNYIKNILKNGLKEHKKGINILLYGKPGTGKTEMARTLIKEIKAEGHEIIDTHRTQAVGNTLDTGLRNSDFATIKRILHNNKNSVILYDEAEDFFRKPNFGAQATKTGVNYVLEDNANPVIWTTNSIHELETSFIRRFTYICHVEYMTKPIYKKIFTKLINESHVKYDDKLFEFCFLNKVSIGIIKKAFENNVLCKNNKIENILEDIKNTLKAYTYIEENIKFNRPTKFNPKLLNTSDDLQAFCNRIVKLNRLDFSLLLYGVSGGGKSFYAEYLAEQLGMPILKKKASDLESMWVGETEKNIAAAFEEAKREKAVLIIDEGDHFISDRTKHRASWETSRTEEMLQQIEAHTLPVIFTTNLMENIDKAAMRRFTYKTKFDYLTKEQVKMAWKDYFPKAELPNEIHLSRLCPGDFATVKKKAEFEDYITNTSLIYSKLEEEMKNKKETENSYIRF